MVDWQQARAQFAPCRRGIAYLNTGALGLISDPVLQAETTWKLFVNEHGRASKTVLDRFENAVRDLQKGDDLAAVTKQISAGVSMRKLESDINQLLQAFRDFNAKAVGRA